MRNVVRGAMEIVEPVEMRVVDAGEVDRLAPALDPRPSFSSIR